MKIYSRAEWGAQAARGMTSQDPQKIGEVFVHHADESGFDVSTFEQATNIVRGVQHFHMHDRGWFDIGYHTIVVPRDSGRGDDYVFAGRDLHYVPAAQLGHNALTYAICVVQKDPEPLREATVRSLVELARRLPQAHHLKGHYEVTATSCPGPIIRARLDEIARRAGKAR